jgi:hypothetical protein
LLIQYIMMVKNARPLLKVHVLSNKLMFASSFYNIRNTVIIVAIIRTMFIS